MQNVVRMRTWAVLSWSYLSQRAKAGTRKAGASWMHQASLASTWPTVLLNKMSKEHVYEVKSVSQSMLAWMVLAYLPYGAGLKYRYVMVTAIHTKPALARAQLRPAASAKPPDATRDETRSSNDIMTDMMGRSARSECLLCLLSCNDGSETRAGRPHERTQVRLSTA